MKFLVDQNLPVELAAWLRDAGCQALHVRDVGLAQRPDEDLILRARREGEVVVTQDAGLAAVAGGDPARWLQVVWVRLGNTSVVRLLAVWAQNWSRIREALEYGDERVELIDERR